MIVNALDSGVFTHSLHYLALQQLDQIPSWLADVVATWTPTLSDRLIQRRVSLCFLQLSPPQVPCHRYPDLPWFHRHTYSKHSNIHIIALLLSH